MPAVQITVPPRAARTYSALELENGGAEGLTGNIGSGSGKWQLVVTSDAPIDAMSLLRSPTGHLTNLSTSPEDDGATHAVPMFPPNMASGPQGFVRVINRGDEAGEVSINAFDDDGKAYETLTLAIEAQQTRHFNSKDLEEGSESKGLVGTGCRPRRLASGTDQRSRHRGAGLRPHLGRLPDRDARYGARAADNQYRVAVFNPGSNTNQLSLAAARQPRRRGRIG